ncbi:hypothetical protein [Nannocystis pusilla]|uniref:hypothetical protein n=1 Tax=Nannocystis pusilla TaxID=889268 RepID=UPI003BF23B62
MSEAIADACAEVGRVIGASRCAATSERFAIRRCGRVVHDPGRAALVLELPGSAAWTSRSAGFRARPPITRVGGSGRFERVLGEGEREEDRAAAAVAALCSFVEASLAAHVAAHPEDEPVCPPVDDAMIGRMFGGAAASCRRVNVSSSGNARVHLSHAHAACRASLFRRPVLG